MQLKADRELRRRGLIEEDEMKRGYFFILRLIEALLHPFMSPPSLLIPPTPHTGRRGRLSLQDQQLWRRGRRGSEEEGSVSTLLLNSPLKRLKEASCRAGSSLHRQDSSTDADRFVKMERRTLEERADRRKTRRVSITSLSASDKSEQVSGGQNLMKRPGLFDLCSRLRGFGRPLPSQVSPLDAPQVPLPSPLAYLEENCFEWNSFDCFELDVLSGRHSLVAMASFMVDRLSSTLSVDLELPLPELFGFFSRLEKAYNRTNPYHNAVHAADVTRAMMWMCVGPPCLLQKVFLSDAYPPESEMTLGVALFACLVGGLAHDVEHPGSSNAFHVKTRSPFAIRYNDRSVLENHHAASTFALLSESGCEALGRLPESTYSTFRELLIELILSTDPSKHFQQLGDLRAKKLAATNESGEVVLAEIPLHLLLGTCLHAADISNPGQPVGICIAWTERIMAEFFAQGDMEAQIGLPVSPLMNRSTTNIAKAQGGFIDILVRPLFTELALLMPPLEEVLENVEKNREYWRKCYDIMEQQMLSGQHSIPSPCPIPFGRLVRGVKPFARMPLTGPPLCLPNDLLLLDLLSKGHAAERRPSVASLGGGEGGRRGSERKLSHLGPGQGRRGSHHHLKVVQMGGGGGGGLSLRVVMEERAKELKDSSTASSLFEK